MLRIIIRSIITIRNMIRMKSERLYMVIPGWLKEEAKAIAESKGITLSEYIKDILKDAVKKEKEQKQD
jgi:antitoxin component of RelBE/YafQ-DinJ toxin-antitoxin module